MDEEAWKRKEYARHLYLRDEEKENRVLLRRVYEDDEFPVQTGAKEHRKKVCEKNERKIAAVLLPPQFE